MNIYDIAKIANVSISTVSRVINDRPGVSDKVRKKVEKIIEEYNFRPNLLARELTNKKTNVIGIVAPGVGNYFAERIRAISSTCKENGYSIMITTKSNGYEDVDGEIENFNLLYEKQVDGIIFFPSRITEKHKAVLDKIVPKTPVVVVGYEIKNVLLPCVVYDNYIGAKMAMRHLIENGHKKISIITGPEFEETSNQRLKAYLDTMNENNLPINKQYIKVGSFCMGSGYTKTLELLQCNSERPTAIFAFNDNMAIGAIKAIQESQLKVPEHISVIGFDNIETTAYTTPSLTTVYQDQHEIGLRAAETLINCIKDKTNKINKVVLEQELIVRESVKKI
ncbi:MAG: LacI family DNA-binding transcriptional regulator [Bacillota bacterium]|nr:LacI family DNA-binding transcriptional regulator [Bacillota bacterium]